MNLDQLPLKSSVPTIKTNNVERPLISGSELTEKERGEFDYIPEGEFDCHEFVKYKGVLYHTGDIMGINPNNANIPQGFDGWHCYESQTFFSGVLFRFSNDLERVVCGSYYS